MTTQRVIRLQTVINRFIFVDHRQAIKRRPVEQCKDFRARPIVNVCGRRR